ncbi:MAG: DUF1559 domain-containing protein [Planctomycetes bacterium]|nr:DUF1559 domain-containing protein [Planctomycetota bacterium]
MSRSNRDGNALINVLVVIGIIVVLIGLFLPGIRRVREPLARTKCMNNLAQLMKAVHLYADVNGPTIPLLGSAIPPEQLPFPPGCFGPGATPEERLSWMVAVLPYIEEVNLYSRFDLEKGYAGNVQVSQTIISLFICPTLNVSPKPEAITHYVAISGIGHAAAEQPAGSPGNGFMGYNRPTSPKMIVDGTSNTIAIMETRLNHGPWARGGTSTLRGFEPSDLQKPIDQQPYSGHAKTIIVAMADGGARYISQKIDPKVLAAAITIAGGEKVELE